MAIFTTIMTWKNYKKFLYITQAMCGASIRCTYCIFYNFLLFDIRGQNHNDLFKNHITLLLYLSYLARSCLHRDLDFFITPKIYTLNGFLRFITGSDAWYLLNSFSKRRRQLPSLLVSGSIIFLTYECDKNVNNFCSKV